MITLVLPALIPSNYEADLKNTLVIGDGENGIYCIQKTGIGKSFCPTDRYVDVVADYVIKEADFEHLKPFQT